MMRRILLATMTVVTATALVTPIARATSPDLLPLPGYGAMVVDATGKRVFVSGGKTSNSVVVVDNEGHVVKKIDSQYGATGLVLSEDGKTLYVAQAAGDAITALSTQTYTEVARYSTGPQTCPTHLARTGNVVWFGYGCENSWDGGIGRLDPSATPPVAVAKHGDVLFQNAPLVTAARDTVVAGQLTTSLSHFRVYRVTGADLTPGAAGEMTGSNLTDAAVSPDATTAFTASGSRTYVQGLATADLANRGSYDTGPYPNSVAVSPDGTHLATGAYTTRTRAIIVHRVGGTVPVRSFDTDGLVVANRGLTWSPDGKTLYAVLQGANDSRPRLSAISRPAA